jgi:hypothetical protein
MKYKLEFTYYPNGDLDNYKLGRKTIEAESEIQAKRALLEIIWERGDSMYNIECVGLCTA